MAENDSSEARHQLDRCTTNDRCTATLHLSTCPKPEPPEPPVVCASCGRKQRQEAGADCDSWAWHMPPASLAPPDDDDAPMTEEDVLAAVGPEPGKTWAELYAKAALQLSYRTAELRGAERELERLRAGGRFVTGINDADSARLVAALVRRLLPTEAGVHVTMAELEDHGRLRVFWTPDTGELVLQVES